MTTRYLLTTRVGHPLAPPSGRVLTHRLVLFDKIGPGTHPCHWCGRPVTWRVEHRPQADSLVGDHLDANRRNNAPDNLVPACPGCNSNRSRTDLVGDDEPHWVTAQGWRRRGVARTCEHCESGFVASKQDVARGQGKFCSGPCKYAARSKQVVGSCEECEATFSAPPSKRRRFCSLSCSTTNRWKRAS